MKLTTQIIDYMVKEYQELLKNELSVISLTSLLHIDDENAQGYMREVLDIEKIEGKSDIRPLLEKYIGEEKYNFAIMYFTEECEIKSYELGKIDESILELFVERGMLDGLFIL